MMENTHGYIIDYDVRVDVGLGAVMRIYSSRKLNFYNTEVIFLGNTGMRLLSYLLSRAEHDVVLYNDILHDVWDKQGLVSSYKRLNQVAKELKEKLVRVGLDEDFIQTVRGKGYRLSNPNVIQLYSKPVGFRLEKVALAL